MMVTSGCTSMLWDEETMAHYFRPAIPSNLKLYFSKERSDILVQYDERRDKDSTVQSRWYWLDANQQAVNRNLMPEFVLPPTTNDGLVPIVVVNETNSPTSEKVGLHAAIEQSNDWFALYDNQKKLASWTLPVYKIGLRKAYRVMLTPLAAANDAAAAGAVGAAAMGAGAAMSPDFWAAVAESLAR
ncbi:hypothetical protein GC207_01990 [bacterium]|nr:hypothetical protein [bacterium]